jgi:glutamyl/glutaminyl-tRNA synthetase
LRSALCAAVSLSSQQPDIMPSLSCWHVRTFLQAIEGGMFKKWIKALGKEKGYKGKNLFMPVRIALTGQMAGPEVGDLLNVLGLEDGECKVEGYTKLYERMDILRDAIDDMAKEPAS